MKDLLKQHCSACEIGAPLVTKEQITYLLATLDGWIIEDSSIDKLVKNYHFKNYKQALKFLNLIASLADAEDHHPKITFKWGLVYLEWWSHKIKGLHINDFICAAKSDEIFKSL